MAKRRGIGQDAVMPSAFALRQLAFRSTAILAASVSVAFAAGCGDDDSASSSGGSTTESSSGGAQVQASTGKQIFDDSGCKSCHTLADAGAKGNIGPNLDEEKPPKDEIIKYVTEGDGRMPSFKDRLSAEQIEMVADYVVEVAGK